MIQHPAFVAATVITVVWLSIVYWWLGQSPVESPEACTLPHAFCALREMELNAAGDFLAGTFSVLAFLWLATAVLLQGSELQRQRDEFVAGRMEMAKQTAMLGKSAEMQWRQIEDEKLMHSVIELFDVIADYLPKVIHVQDRDCVASTISLPECSTDLVTHDKIEAALNLFSRQLRAAVGPISRNEQMLSIVEHGPSFHEQCRLVQLKARQVLDKQSTVSVRYDSSRLFANAAMIESVCALFTDPDHQIELRDSE